MRRFERYAREVAFALRAGATARDGLQLAATTVLFHLGNLRGAGHASRAGRYRVTLLGSPHDLWLRTHAGDVFVLHELFLSDCYDVPGFDWGRAQIIIDLGANIGLATLRFAARAPRAMFVCVEPQPGNVALLRRNLAALPQAIVMEAAVAASDGVLAFDDVRPSWGGTAAASGRLNVRAVSMATVLAHLPTDARIDLLKIDIEGGEVDLFSGDLGWIDRVNCVVAELHPPFTQADFARVFAPRGFAVYAEGEAGHALPTAVRRA